MVYSADEKYMRRCLQLAVNGLGRVRPNPLVGCVIATPDRVIAEGYHQQYGHNHAERNALAHVADHILPADATLYVNLEPCSHHGHTPPCADLLIDRGVRRVVCCNDDPNPLVAGNGFRKLEQAGIEVVRHVLEAEGRWLNRRFFTYMEAQRPYIILKWAESSDGFMAPTPCGEHPTTNNQKKYWLSTSRQNRLNHRWRTEEAAILVGSETYLSDRPQLTARHFMGPQPQPVVVDRRQRITQLPSHWLHLQSANIRQLINDLYAAQLQSVIVEGGRQLLDAFIKEGCYDEVRILRSHQKIGSGLPAPDTGLIDKNRITWY